MESEFLTVPPCKITKEFTANEIQKLENKLNIDKAPGPDKLKSEFIKKMPLHQHINRLQTFTTQH